jgi:DNA polymerase/3'-5' exonuclease PolX
MSILQLTQTIQIVPAAKLRRGKKPLQPTLPSMELPANTPPKVTNEQLIEVLSSIINMIEQQNGNPYRIQAYNNAIQGLRHLTEPATDILARGEALPIPGLGKRLRTRIQELIQSGSTIINNGYYIQSLPTGVQALLSLDYVGPYTAIRLHEELGIDSVEKLVQAATRQDIRHLSGFGIRSEARLLASARQSLQKVTSSPTQTTPGGSG